MDKAILEALKHCKSGEKVALATIISSKGSTPRGKGTSILIYADGRTVGTIGGGCAEAEVKMAALTAIDNQETMMHHADLYSDLAAEEGMVCGGTMDVFIEPIPDPEIFQLMESFQSQNQKVYSCVAVKGTKELPAGTRGLYDADGGFIGGVQVVEELPPEWRGEESVLTVLETGGGESQMFVQPVVPPYSLLILGGGYIAQALVSAASQLDFEITVVDDRADFANPGRFPGAQVICNSFANALDQYQVNSSTYIVIVTRGHRYDAECLRKVVSSPAAYIGLIGSRRRTRLLFRQLAEEGYPEEDLSRVKTPIGLDIGGETPGEIAISILAEIILQRRKGVIYRENGPKKQNS